LIWLNGGARRVGIGEAPHPCSTKWVGTDHPADNWTLPQGPAAFNDLDQGRKAPPEQGQSMYGKEVIAVQVNL
jgi:hypothetical protein